jgi:hypothetical protein
VHNKKTYLSRRHVKETSIEQTWALDKVSIWRLRRIANLASWIIMRREVEAICRHGCMDITPLFQKFPEKFSIVGTTRHTTGHANNS